jgi:putative heme-binding domain-containing protein
MPHLGSQTIDLQNLTLIGDRITSLGIPIKAESKELSRVSQALATLHDPSPEQRDAGLEVADPLIHDLFQRFKLLKPALNQANQSVEIGWTQLAGDAENGRNILLGSQGAICLTCHRLGDQGMALEPRLDGVAKRLEEQEIVDSLLEPSIAIAPAFLNYQVETKAGDKHSGFLLHHDAQQLVLRQALGKETIVRVPDIATMSVSDQSLMPAGLMQAFSAQEAADLLAYLCILK